MPIYDYFCEKCELDFELLKSMVEHQKTEPCPQCGNMAPQDLSRCRPLFTGTKVEDAEFNIGLGAITKSKYDRSEKAKRIGAVEIGNEKPEVIHDHFDSRREEKLRKAYDDI